MKYILFVILFLPVTAFSQWEWNVRLDNQKDRDSLHVMMTDTSGSFVGRGTFIQLDSFIRLIQTYLPTGGVTDGDKGDITASSNGTIWQLDANSVGANEIQAGSVQTGDIQNGTVGALDIEDTAVTPGSYTNASITVDQDGRLTAASSGAVGVAADSLDANQTDGAVEIRLLDGTTAIDSTTIDIDETISTIHKREIIIFDECLHADGTDAGFYSITGVGTPVNSLVSNNSVGVRLTTVDAGAELGGVSLLSAIATSRLELGHGMWTYEIRIDSIATLSNATNNYAIFVGFTNGYSSVDEFSNGVGFLYDSIGVFSGSQASAQWQLHSADAAGGTNTYTDTDVTVSINPVILKMVINSDASSVDFYINGVLEGTITTDIPNGSGESVTLGYYLTKDGTNSDAMYVDYQYARCVLNTQR